MHHDRHGAKQHDRFNAARAAVLNDRERFSYVSPDTLLAELALAPSALLVDFGSGTGLYAVALARRRPDLRIVALDEQAAMLEHVRTAIEQAGVKNAEAADQPALDGLRERADGV